jgi:CrcB protein
VADPNANPPRRGPAVRQIDPDLGPAEQATAHSPFPPGPGTRPRVAWSVLGVISAGGVVGTLARYGLGVAFPHPPGGFPWATFAVNVSGCLLIGVLMVLVTDVWSAQRLLRQFLGTGVLGGYTTFSTYVVDIQHLLAAGASRTALAYLAGTVLGALAAVQVGTTTTRATVAASRRRHTDRRYATQERPR